MTANQTNQTWQTIPEMVLSVDDRFGDAEAVVDGSLRLSFAQLADRIRCAAGAFASFGIEKGDRVAIWAPNSAEWLIAAFGLVTAGGVLVPVNTRFKPGEAADVIDRSKAKAVLVEKNFLGLDFAGTVTASRRGDSFEDIATTAGTACDGVEVRIGDDGEVLVRGYNVMRGYFDDPAATAEAIDRDGWLHTGDMGTLDAADRLRIDGRKKDMFIVGGFNAYPVEIEGFLLEHPAVAQVAVIGIPDQRLGQVGKAPGGEGVCGAESTGVRRRFDRVVSTADGRIQSPAVCRVSG